MKRRVLIALVGMLVAVGLNGASASVSPDADIDPMAEYLLQQMTRRLASAEQLTFRVEATVDAVDTDGLTVQTAEAMDVALRRPDRLAVRTQGDEGRRGFRYDGLTATIYHADLQVYSFVEAAQTVDATLDLLEREYAFTLPMADLIHSDPLTTLLDGATEGHYLGMAVVDGVPGHHLVFRRPDVDWQIWVEDSIWMYPLKFVATYKQPGGSSQYTARFSDWDYGATLTEEVFEFDPPPVAMSIRWSRRSE